MAEQQSDLNSLLPDNAWVFDDSHALAESLACEIVELANKAIAENGVFRFITAGGTTPNQCYRLLAELPADCSDWTKWHIYLGDERLLPLGDSELNSYSLVENWLKFSSIPVQNWHFIEEEKGAEAAAYDYACLIQGIDEFDLALVGMGEDGHTASLFPGHNESEHVVPINCTPADDKGFNCAAVIIENHSPKPPAQRISLNYISFRKSRLLIKLITGASKKAALDAWLRDKQPLPIALLQGQQSKIYLDQAAIK